MWVQQRHECECRYHQAPTRRDWPGARSALHAFQPTLLGSGWSRGRQGPPRYRATAGPLAERGRAPFARAPPRRARLDGSVVLTALLFCSSLHARRAAGTHAGSGTRTVGGENADIVEGRTPPITALRRCCAIAQAAHTT